MRNRLIVLVVVVLAAVLIVLAVRSRSKSKAAVQPASLAQSGSQGSSLTPGAAMTQQQLMRDIIRQGVTPERAKLLFSMVVGPLPGVTVPAGSRDPSDFDGTLAVGYIYKVWASLTPEQRAAAAQLINHSRSGPGKQSESRGPFFTQGLPRLIPASYVLFDNAPAYDYENIAQTANGTIAAFLNVAPVTFTLNVEYGPQPEDVTEFAHTWSWYRSQENPNAPDIPYLTGCEITLWNQKFQTLDEPGAESVVTHEMFHCFQQRVEGSAEAAWSVHPWLREGEATWVMCTIVPAANFPRLQERWGMYTSAPGTVYTDRSYDAVGLYGHLSDLTSSATVWPKLLPMITAGLNGRDTDALTLLLEGYQNDYFTSWGSSYFRVTGNVPWAMFGPGTPPNNSPAAQAVSVDSNTIETLAPAGPYLGEQFQLNGGPDILMVSLLTGYGRVHDGNFSLDTALSSSSPLALCLKQGGCKCPDGSAGASTFTKNAVAPISVGINGGETTAMVGVAGESLDKFCKQPEPNYPPPPPGSGGGGGGGGDNPPPDQPPPPPPQGSSLGDPHMETFDGLGYDLQAVGEYTLVRSTKDDLAVQIRQVPALGPKIASINQAVAARIGGQRVTFTMENGAPVLRVDGKVITGAMPKLKGGSLSGAATSFGGVYLLTWPDGTTLSVEQLGSTAINVKVRPAASRKGTLAGLLGDFDGSQDNDLVAGSAKLGKSFTRDDLNHILADAWRVTQANSLFDYAPGQSAKSFLDPDFPAKDAVAARLSNYDTAEKTCRAHGITDRRLLENCILDLAVTNNFVFGSQYAHAQQVLAAHAAITRPTSLPNRRKLWVDGEILDATSEPEFHFEGNKGDVIWVGHDPECRDRLEDHHGMFFWLMDPSGKRLDPTGFGCDFPRHELPATGNYTLKAVFHYKGETVRYHVPVQFVRADRKLDVSYGQMVSGSIEQRAARDVYSWVGREGDLVLVSGQGCELGFMLTVIYDPDGHDYLGPNCRVGTYYKVPKDGMYQFVVNGDNSPQPGPYQFVFQGGKLPVPKD